MRKDKENKGNKMTIDVLARDLLKKENDILISRYINEIRKIMEGYCEVCGNKHLPCYCLCDD